MLDLKFPYLYSLFLENYGAGDIMGIEIFGIIKDPTKDKFMIPNGIWLTLNLRKESGLPQQYVVISETGYGAYYAIDTSEKSLKNESPVYIWDIGDQLEKVNNSFADFLSTSILESLENDNEN